MEGVSLYYWISGQACTLRPEQTALLMSHSLLLAQADASFWFAARGVPFLSYSPVAPPGRGFMRPLPLGPLFCSPHFGSAELRKPAYPREAGVDGLSLWLREGVVLEPGFLFVATWHQRRSLSSGCFVYERACEV